jgi:hypothetical protein
MGRLIIESDGTPNGTKILSESTREQITNVTSINWTISYAKGSEAVITLVDIPVKAIAEKLTLKVEGNSYCPNKENESCILENITHKLKKKSIS